MVVVADVVVVVTGAVVVVVAGVVVVAAQSVGVMAITVRPSTNRGLRCLYKATSSRLAIVTVTIEVEQ